MKDMLHFISCKCLHRCPQLMHEENLGINLYMKLRQIAIHRGCHSPGAIKLHCDSPNSTEKPNYFIDTKQQTVTRRDLILASASFSEEIFSIILANCFLFCSLGNHFPQHIIQIATSLLFIHFLLSCK